LRTSNNTEASLAASPNAIANLAQSEYPQGARSRAWSGWLLLGAITLLAACLRFYRLANFPLGLHFDEAYQQVEALTVLAGHHAVFFPVNMGLDALPIYVIALVFKLFGVTTVGGRIAAALAGTLTVPAIWWAAREFSFGWTERYRTALAASAAFLLATLQWHLTFSRTGIQPIWTPLFATLTVAALWRGLRTGKWPWFVISGLALSAGLYAYSASRMVPLLLIAIAIWVFVFERTLIRKHWRHLGLTLAVAALAVAPLGLYFLQHPEWLTYRTSQVVAATVEASSPARVLWQNLLKTLAAFSIRGDLEIIRNLPGRPALDPWQSALLLVGIAVCLRNWRRKEFATLLLWLALLLVPTIATDYAPHYGRALGATPAVALLVALGLVTAARAVETFWSRRRVVAAVAYRGSLAVLAGGLVIGAGVTAHAYFVCWGSLPGLYQAYDVGLLAASEDAAQRSAESQVLLSPISTAHPIVRFATRDQGTVRSYDGRISLLVPASTGRPTDYVIVPSLDDRSLSRLQALCPAGEIVAAGGYQGDTPYYQVFRVPAARQEAPTPQHPAAVTWAGSIELLGYDTDKAQYQPGDTVTLTLYWRDIAPVTESYTVFTHLLGTFNPLTNGLLWAGSDHEPGQGASRTSLWQPGDLLADDYLLLVPNDAPPGPYSLEVGLYKWPELQRLTVSASSVEAGADFAVIGEVRITDAK
jgi:4-amino-4-deoxy-L-arabinose transferase-like glycosyltransferase